MFAMLNQFAPSLVLGDVSTALNAFVTLIVGWAPAIVAFALVIEGVMMATAIDDAQKQTNIKRAIGYTIAGGLLIIIASDLATKMITSFQK